MKGDIFQKYQIFFQLRDEYPQYVELLGEIMNYAFRNKDSFSSNTYLKGKFSEEDVFFIFEKLGIVNVKKVIYSNLREQQFTIVQFEVKENNNIIKLF